jgi:phytoene dehydrogenase-like protein
MRDKILSQVTRRRFLKLMAMAGATAAIDWHSIDVLAASIPDKKNYPVVVIGAGLGGLISAAYLSQNGFPVTLMEKHDRPGGYATAFERAAGKFSFEVSLHATVAENAMPQKILSELKVWENLKVVDTPEFCRLVHPDFDLMLPAGDPHAFVDLLISHFPKEKTGIRSFIQDMVRVQSEMRGRIGKESVMDRLEGLSLADWLTTHITDPRLKNILSVLWGYFGQPPTGMNALYFAIAMGEYIVNGGQYYKTRSQDLSDTLMAAVVSHGGDTLMQTQAARIGVEKDRVAWVADNSGHRYPAKAVVVNANAPDLFAKLLPPDSMPADYQRRMASMSPSVSSCIVWLGLNQELPRHIKGYEIVVSNHSDPETEYRHILAGNYQHMGLGVTLYDNLFRGYSHPGTSTLSIMTLCGYAPWQKYEEDYLAGHKAAYKREKQAMTDLFIQRIQERLIPGLRDMIEVVDSATPLTNLSYTGNPRGAIYGFSRPLDQLKALDVRTPLKGLYMASAWTHGGGYTPAMMAGRQAAEALLMDWKK